MTRWQLCQTLVDQHFDGRNTGMAQTHAAGVHSPTLTRRQLEIVWITPKTAFFEAINTGGQVTRTVNDQQVQGFPKASTELAGPNGAGFGQWIVGR